MAKAGDRIGPYVLVEKLGRGAFGVVWLAEKRGAIFTSRVALKMPNDEDVDLGAVSREAHVWARAAGHPNVLPIIDADLYDGQVVIVSEYAPDGSLSAWAKRHGGKAPSVESAARMIEGVLAGLEHLHSKNIIHRDLKPDNILLQGETPRLADFGIARVLKTTSPSYTMVSGTPKYMAPEAFRGMRSEQTDLWAVGVMLQQLLTGAFPYPHEDAYSLMYALHNEMPVPLPASTPGHLQEITAKSLEKDTERRYRSATEMREEVQRFIHSRVAGGGGWRRSEAEIPTIKSFPETTSHTQEISGVSHATSPEPPDEEETLLRKPEERAVEFIGNDRAYLQWLSQNPAGYVVNTHRSVNPNYMVLHKATCGMIKSTQGIPPGGFTERSYIKICSGSIEGLRVWTRQHGRPDGSFSKSCTACKPSGEYSPPTNQPESSASAGEVASIDDPVVAININKQYPWSKTAEELYQATRGIWRLNRRRAERARYAFAVYQGVIKEVYVIHRWMAATKETTGYWDNRSASQGKYFPSEVNEGRSEFIGELAPEDVRQKYVGQHMPKRHSQNPILYFNC
jgi:serine/threonine protein kinase